MLAESEARVLTDEVKRDGEALWRKLVRLHDGGAHNVLGYSSWHAYCESEFGFKQAQAYRLLHAGRAAEIIPWDNRPTNERQARELAPLLTEPEKLQEAWAEVRELHSDPTASDVRAVVQRKMGVHYSSATPEWSTPQDLFDQLNNEFGFELDVCATAENAKCARYFTEADDGLAQSWEGVCWMNPPYGQVIGDWVRKAWEAGQAGATVVCLVPARVDTGWWWDYARFGEVRFLRGRLKFGGGDTGAPFPSAVVIFGRRASVVWWEREAA